jgi:hypothetical protein
VASGGGGWGALRPASCGPPPRPPRGGGWSAGPFGLVLPEQALGGLQPPGLFEDVPQVGAVYASQPNQHGGIPAVVLCDEERLGIGLEAEVALVVAAFDDEGLAVLPQTGEELAAHAKARGAVARPLLDARQGER